MNDLFSCACGVVCGCGSSEVQGELGSNKKKKCKLFLCEYVR